MIKSVFSIKKPTIAMQTKLKYLANNDKPTAYIASKGGGDKTEHLGDYIHRPVSILNGRVSKQSSNLDKEGFLLAQQFTKVTDFYDEAQVTELFYDEVRTLIKETTSAKRVEIFDHTRRSSSLQIQKEKGIREAATIIHNDYTADSGIKRLEDHFMGNPGEAKKLLQRRFAIINVWRSISGTVYNHPLTLCDATTVSPQDLVCVERRSQDRLGEIQVALHNPKHRWYYFPNMQMDEALLFKTFDSETDGRARFTIHSSFEDSNAVADTPPRESIETRCLVFF